MDGTSIDNFACVMPLGKGGFGQVQLVSGKISNKLFAMKLINAKDKVAKKSGYRELDVDSELTRTGGTLHYKSPEVQGAGQGDDIRSVRRECDYWSVGVILFEMLYGKHPFNPQNDFNEREIKKRILEKCPNLSRREKGISQSGFSLLEKLLIGRETRLGRKGIEDFQNELSTH